MKRIEISNMASIEAGKASVSGVIDGVCAAVTIGGALGWVVLGPAAWITVGVGCAVNAYAGTEGWW